MIKNSKANLVEFDNKISGAATQGGNMGEAPILCEGVPFSIQLKNLSAQKVQLFALDESGNRKTELPVQTDNENAVISPDGSDQTIWYELIVK